ncbi:hypothetical protein [Tissierella praeacuta]|uniref:hypothetical protein n=1 Tax=Tissierella praeacuta TaxID=43131 RepID=UPI002FDB00BB
MGDIQSKQIYISDTVHNTITVSSIEMDFVSSTLFNRLHNISQNSTAYLTFPTNRTKRFEHSLGTMKLSGDIFYYSICNTESEVIETFFDKFKEEVHKIIDEEILSRKESKYYRGIIGDKNLKEEKLKKYEDLYSSIDNVFYNYYMPNNILKEQRFLYMVLFQAIRLAALLHDLGHPPYSHITEGVMEKVYKDTKKKKGTTTTVREKEFLKIMEDYTEESGKEKLALHEAMGNNMVKKLVENYFDNFSEIDSFEHKYYSILVCICLKRILEEKTIFFKDVHGIISGPLDGDRLDYVTRDMMNSGFNNGIIEYERIIYSIKISIVKSQDEDNVNFFFTPTVKSLATVEDFYSRRWNLYKNIIFHHRVAKTDAMLELSLESLMKDYLEKEELEESEKITNVLPNDISGLWKAIEFAASNSEFFDNLSQWDDNWITTILKKEFFEKYYNGDDPVKFKLEEFLSNNKHYYSLIKSKTDFDILESKLEIAYDEIIDIDSEDLSYFIKIIENKNQKSFIERLDGGFKSLDNKYDIYDVLMNETKLFMEQKYSDEVSEVITIRKKIKTGLETELLVSKKGKPFLISRLSTIKEKLERETSSPYFYIYIRYCEGHKKEIFDETKVVSVLEELGVCLSGIIIREINTLLEKKEEQACL